MAKREHTENAVEHRKLTAGRWFTDGLAREVVAARTGGLTATTTTQDADSDWVLNDLDGALRTAKEQNKLVFVDFTG